MKVCLAYPLEVTDISKVPAQHAGDWEFVMTGRNGKLRPVPFWKIGTVWDYPGCIDMIFHGVARPSDDEAWKECGLTPEQVEAKIEAYLPMRDAIAPEDRGFYKLGYIAGYNGDGSYKPGPNWDEFQKLLAEAEAKAAEDDEED